MRTKQKSTPAAERRNQRALVEERDGPLVLVAVQRVRDLLADERPKTLSRNTRIERRLIQRLKDGKQRSTHLKRLQALADWCHIDVLELIDDASRPPESPGEFLSFVRANEFLGEWGYPPTISPQSIEGFQFAACLRELFLYDAWVAELYPYGTPIADVSATKRGGSNRRTVRLLQARRRRFANAMASALATLLEPHKDLQTTNVSAATVKRLRSTAVSQAVFAMANGLGAIGPGHGDGLQARVKQCHDAMLGRLRKRGQGIVRTVGRAARDGMTRG